MRLLCTHAQSRPFGVALLVAGFEKGQGPVLYHTDPSGMFVEYDAKAIGSGSEGAQTVRCCLHRLPAALHCTALHCTARTALHACIPEPALHCLHCTVRLSPKLLEF